MQTYMHTVNRRVEIARMRTFFKCDFLKEVWYLPLKTTRMLSERSDRDLVEIRRLTISFERVVCIFSR